MAGLSCCLRRDETRTEERMRNIIPKMGVLSIKTQAHKQEE